MEDTCYKEESESLPPGIFELPGEPAVLINGVPDVSRSQDTSVKFNCTSESEAPKIAGFGEWLEGREVKKKFGDQHYSGTVTQFDKETGWYRAVYEDGDFEDLEWHELRDVLVPLDITMPLKTLALKVLKKSYKPDLQGTSLSVGTNYSPSPNPSTHKTKSGRPRGRPPKVKQPDLQSTLSSVGTNYSPSPNPSTHKTKSGRPRGRPRKVKQPDP